MTMQVGMVGSDGVLIASDTLWMNTESHQFASVRHTSNTTKIEIDYKKGVAIACARNMELAGRIARDMIREMSIDEWGEPGLRGAEIANKALSESREDRREFQCTIATAYPEPQLFQLHAGIFKLQKGAHSQRHSRKIMAGDMVNAAAFWAERYYSSSDPLLPIRELAFLAAHLVCSAGKLHSAGIGGLEIVLCDSSGIHRLSENSIRVLESSAVEWDRQFGELIFGDSQQFTYAPNMIG